ncbi:MAG: flagellar filament capping protein FliD [Fimbriimonadaceae bacterium]|nr:flagellar filament capping protein FliD [Fimbriimonadaceae bacterium]
MSINGSLSGISFSGLGSGIDTESIVSRLLQIEQIPLQRLQTRRLQFQNQQSLYSELRSRTSAVGANLNSLRNASTFSPVKATSSSDSVATVSSDASATPGSFELAISKLAKIHRATGSAQSSGTAELGYAGEISVNGKLITIETTDSLTAIAGKINSKGAGVSATVVNGANGQAYLSLSASSTGKSNSISFADITGTVAANLGLIGGGTTLRDATGADLAKSLKFTDGSATLNTLTGRTGAGSFSVGGNTVNFDWDTDTLDSLAAKINVAAGGVSATVKSETKNGSTKSYLELSGTNVESLLSDSGGALETLGVLQRGFTNQISAAQDAEFTVDGIALTSDTNTVTGVVAGVTMTLKDADATTPKTTTISIARDTATILDTVKAFVTGYNSLDQYVRDNSQFDSETFQSGPLFGDPIARQVTDKLADMLFTRRANVGTGEYADLTQIGFSRSTDGKLTLDESKLMAALETNPQAVIKLFTDVGSTSTPDLTYITGSAKTQNLSGVSVEITQLPTLHKNTGAAGTGAVNAGGETLTFGGAVFGNKEILFDVSSGMTRTQLANAINSDSRLRDYITATVVGDALIIESKVLGSPGRFTAVSNLDSADDNSGLGTTGGTEETGVDVAGTINGEATTGSGNLLTGKANNATTDGLQLRYTGNTLGVIGTVSFSPGLASTMANQVNNFTDSVSGLFKATDDGITAQIADVDRSIENLQAQLELREITLRARFTAMDQAVQRYQAQLAQLQAQISG